MLNIDAWTQSSCTLNILLTSNSVVWALAKKVWMCKSCLRNSSIRWPLDDNWAASWQNQQNDLCAQQRLSSAWASTQSHQSLRCPHEEILGPQLPIECTAKTLIRLQMKNYWVNWAHSEDSDQTGRMPRLIWVFARHTDHFVGFVIRRLNSSFLHKKEIVGNHQNHLTKAILMNTHSIFIYVIYGEKLSIKYPLYLFLWNLVIAFEYSCVTSMGLAQRMLPFSHFSKILSVQIALDMQCFLFFVFTLCMIHQIHYI